MEQTMANNIHTLVRAAAVLALAGACASAFAQSNEYRRGYDDGFAAGQRAALEQGGGRPDWGRVHIEEAFYGAHGAVCDARRSVRESVARNRGMVEAGNQLCGDPAPGQPKRLRIVYSCDGTAPARVVANEHESLRLSCRR
jgi:hypothetical protein